MADVHLAQMLFDRADLHAGKVAIRSRQNGAPFSDLTFAKMKERVQHISAGLLTIPGGTKPGTCITLVSYTRLEWVLCDYAILALGAHSVPIYSSLLAPEIGYVHQDTSAEIAFIEDKAAYEKIRQAQQGFTFFEKSYAAEKMHLRHLVVFDPAGIEPADDWESLADLEARGHQRLRDEEAELQSRRETIKREDVATYVYTSGTTGPPKGVIQTHDNHLSILENSEETQMFAGNVQEAGAFLFLPLAHSFGRLIEFGSGFYANPLILSSPDTLLADLQATRPGFFPAAPRVYEKIFSKIQSGLPDAPPLRQKLFHWATGVGARVLKIKEQGRSPTGLLALQHALADKIVLSKIRARLGLDRVEILLSGSAALSSEVQTFFGATGLIIYEAYGLTETTPGLTANRPDKWRTGTVGSALMGVEIRIASDGEVLAKGPNITSGYLHRVQATKEAFDDDGWFHTGDIGQIDADGFLRLTDRKKDLIKTSGGKYVAPQKIEGLLKNHPLIFEAAVIGDTRNYCVALIAVDDEALETWAKRNESANDAQAQTTRAALQESVDEVNRGLAPFESIKYFRIIDEMPSTENGMLTGSFKLKRRVLAKRYAELIDDMYESGSKSA